MYNSYLFFWLPAVTHRIPFPPAAHDTIVSCPHTPALNSSSSLPSTLRNTRFALPLRAKYETVGGTTKHCACYDGHFVILQFFYPRSVPLPARFVSRGNCYM